MTSASKDDGLKFALPTTGYLFEEDESQYVLCKPMLMPVKTIALEKMEKMQQDAEEKFKTRSSTANDASSTKQ